ncbi:MAG TPA: hypothetical protein VFV92_02235 [Candidatus Bathyarchaeia archaeon]|nr:hypothetical protein [Candidatus Bathyarchaeia archaeon]
MGMKWTAFLRLKGETWTKKREEMPDEFEGLVQFLRGVDVEYNLVVLVEAEGSRVLHSQNSGQGTEAWARRQESGI